MRDAGRPGPARPSARRDESQRALLLSLTVPWSSARGQFGPDDVQSQRHPRAAPQSHYGIVNLFAEVRVQNRLVSVWLAMVCLLGVTVSPVAAQPPTSSEEFDLNVGALYDVAMNEWNLAANVGGHADVAKRFLQGATMNAAIVGEVGFNHFESFDLTNYLGGLRFAGNYSTQFSPFAQVLLGVERGIGDANFALQTGIGIDIPWKPQFAIRIQGDWRHVYRNLDDADGLRVSAGLVFPLN